MVKWIKNYYTGEGVEEPARIRRKINAGKFVPEIYLLTLSNHPDNLCDIIPAFMLMQKGYREICPLIFGMAKGKDEAMEMAAELLGEIYRETGSFKVAEYLKNR
ncbi:MAG: hypothetical protein Q4F03_05860 [Eubacteriales bacterium]|nr:hypothetical protein [Eubacteriales bacterium]